MDTGPRLIHARARWPVLLGTLIALTTIMTPTATAQDALPVGITKGVTVEGITEYTLTNGLKVLLLQDASQPKVTVNATIFVGSRHEGYGETGMAHLLEHMVFKGTPKFPDVPKALRDHGANFNGTTSIDRTNYFETMSATDDNLEFGIELEADRMVNSFIAREELMKEFTVVRNEFERGENNTLGILLQRMQAAAFEWHNYGKSTIGNRTDIERVPIDNLQEFYRKFYQPDNAMLVIAGKFDAAKALQFVAKHYGPIPRPKRELSQTYTEEPAQDGERIVTLRRVGDSGAAGVLYHIPAASHPDYAACEVLASVLSTPPNGRVYKALVETKLASGAFVFARNSHDPSMLIAVAQTTPETTMAARDALINTLENLKSTPLNEDEVGRAKRQLLQQRERTLSNTQLFAISLSDWAGCGDWRMFFLHRDRLEGVTAADVNRVADTYMKRSNRTVGVYEPTAKPERTAVPAGPDIAKLVEQYKGREAQTAGEAFDPTPENVEKRVVRGVLPSGVKTAYLSKKTRGATVVLNGSLDFGNLTSLQNKAEAAEMIGEMMLLGTATKNREQIRDALEALNATLRVSSDAGGLNFSLQTKSANLPAVIALLEEILRTPSFPESEFEIVKREALDGLNRSKSDPQSLADNALNRKLAPYPPSDPRYVTNYAEAIDRMKALSLADVKSLYKEQVGGTSGEIVIVGEFDPNAVKAPLEKMLSGWTSEVKYERIPNSPAVVAGGTEKIITPDKANAVFVGGLNFKLKTTDPEYPAMVVGNYALGAAPLASRLSIRVRGKEGLSYGVSSRVSASSLEPNGRFTLFAITNPMNMSKVDAIMGEEVSKFLKEGMSASELEEAKKAYVQAQRVARGSDAALAGQLASGLRSGQTFEYYAELEKRIEALQPADIKKAFDLLVDPKNLVIIQAGDLPKAGAAPKGEPKP